MKMPVSKKSLCNTCIGNDYKTISFIMWLPTDNTFYVTFWCGSYWKVNGLRTLYKFFRIRVTSCLRSLGTSLHNGILGTVVCDREKDLKHLGQITSSSETSRPIRFTVARINAEVLIGLLD